MDTSTLTTTTLAIAQDTHYMVTILLVMCVVAVLDFIRRFVMVRQL